MDIITVCFVILIFLSLTGIAWAMVSDKKEKPFVKIEPEPEPEKEKKIKKKRNYRSLGRPKVKFQHKIHKTKKRKIGY